MHMRKVMVLENLQVGGIKLQTAWQLLCAR